MILTVTLNPALDRVMFIPRFVSGNANRIYRRENCIGGKGAHVSWNLIDLGVPSTATGVVMGPTGRQFLSALGGAGVDCDFYEPADGGGDTRTNYIIVEDTGVCSLVCEKGPALTQAVLDAFLAFYEARAAKAEYIVVSGDASNYATPEGLSFQTALLEIGRKHGAKVFLDANGGSLREGVRSAPYLIKPNLQELSELTGMPTATERETVAAIRSLDAFGVYAVAASRGGDGSIVRIGDAFYRAGVAKIDYVNEVGCGDAYLAGLVCGLSSGWPAERTIAFATACGGAEAESPLTVGLDAARVNALCDTVTVERMHV